MKLRFDYNPVKYPDYAWRVFCVWLVSLLCYVWPHKYVQRFGGLICYHCWKAKGDK